MHGTMDIKFKLISSCRSTKFSK